MQLFRKELLFFQHLKMLALAREKNCNFRSLIEAGIIIHLFRNYRINGKAWIGFYIN